MAHTKSILENDPQLASVYEKLKPLRTRTDLKLKPTKYLRPTLVGLDGVERPLELRQYQIQMVYHLLAMRRFVVGDDCGLGKTLCNIATLCQLWERDPTLKALILTTKSATPQWVAEFGRFTQGVWVKACMGTAKQRTAIQQEFASQEGPAAIVMGYRSAAQDFTALQKWSGYVVIFDEATAFKNPQAQIHQVVKHFAGQACRVYGLTATLIKNNLLEGYGIFKVIAPDVFPMNPQSFMIRYCLVEMIDIPRSNRKVPKIIGYDPEQIALFKEAIDPFFLGRAKHEVATELPALTIKTVECPLTEFQAEKYVEALDGLIEVGYTSDEGPVTKETTKLTALIYCQQVVNHPELLDCEGESEKQNVLMDLLQDGELSGQKVIVYSRFKSMVDILMRDFAKAKIKAVRVTGGESANERAKAQKAFQDPKDPTQVICITQAGGDAINLQTASAIVFYDTPWSAGDYLQILGRAIRIGSTHENVYALHLVSKWRKATIDQKVMDVLSQKMNVVEAVLGNRSKGDTGMFGGNPTRDLLDALLDEGTVEGERPSRSKKARTPSRVEKKSLTLVDQDELDFSNFDG